MDSTRHKSREGNPRGVKVLVYHRIVDDEKLAKSHPSWIHVQEFRRQLELLDRWGFTTITFDDYRLFQDGELSLPRKPLIITFDDGYADLHKYAFPLLEEFGMRGVMFVLGERKIRTNVWDKIHGLPEAQLMDDYQILELHSAGFEIGAHSLTHVKLTHLSDHEAWKEISRSRILLEILLNAPVRSFSYPYGLVNSEVKRMTEEAGYYHGCGVYSGPPLFGQDNFEIRRISVTNALGPLGFALRLLTPFQYIDWYKWKISRLLRPHDNGQDSLNGKKVATKKRSRSLEPESKK